jgi:hypothetical protein
MHLRLFSDFSHKHFVTYSQSVPKEHRTPQACRSAPEDRDLICAQKETVGTAQWVRFGPKSVGLPN